MRRGHTFGWLVAISASAAALAGAPTALADTGAPGDICQQVASGQISANDPIVQGYCGPLVTVTPPVTEVLPATTPPGTQPVVVAPATTGVAGVSRTIVAPKPATTSGVQGQQHTVRTPVTHSAAAPLGTSKVSGTLPFTGAELGLFALVGLALVASGLMLRSTGRTSERS